MGFRYLKTNSDGNAAALRDAGDRRMYPSVSAFAHPNRLLCRAASFNFLWH